jgi:RNA polymerase sigma-70 factor, ECF subfamily
MTNQTDFTDAWDEHRRYVLDLAFRMLGSISDAEDVVQDTFARLLRTDISEIDDVRGWLVVAVSRRCLDRLRSAQWRRETAGDPAQFAAARVDPAATDPADRVTLDDSVGLALLVVIERLSPAERTAFVLHDVFGLTFDDVAEIVGRTPAACRQLASRARRHIQADTEPGRFTIETAEQRRVTERFIAASSTGDLAGLLDVLDPDVAGQADLGGRIGLLPPIVGRENVAQGILAFFGPGSETTLLTLPAPREPAVLAIRGQQPFAVVTLSVRDGRVHHIHSVVDPEKLAPIARLLSART